jgi:hypothetical protein
MNIYLDENLSEYVADALNSLNNGYFKGVTVSSTKITFGRGVADEELIPKIGSLNGILITRDININRTRLQNELCKEHNLGVFFICLPKNDNRHWNLVTVLVERWEEIINITKNKRGAFSYRIKSKGKVELLK